MEDTITELTAACDALRAVDQQRAQQMTHRDDLIRQAKAAGLTWHQLQDATGMGPRGVKQALERK